MRNDATEKYPSHDPSPSLQTSMLSSTLSCFMEFPTTNFDGGDIKNHSRFSSLGDTDIILTWVESGAGAHNQRMFYFVRFVLNIWKTL